MADAKISALPAASAATLASTFPANVGGATQGVTVDQIIVLDNSVTGVFAAASSSQAPTGGTDTYITGSRLLVPAASGRGSLKAGSFFRWRIQAVKTAAGTVAPIFTVRYGTAGTTSDTAICTATGVAQTAVADFGVFTISCIMVTVGSGTSATARAIMELVHNTQAASGLGGLPTTAPAIGSGFNSTTASAGVGLSVNTGTSAAWTLSAVTAEMLNLT